MPLTPEDVSNKRFTPVRLREGYDMGEVDQFLDEVEAELGRLLKDNDDLRERLRVAQENPSAARGSRRHRRAGVRDARSGGRARGAGEAPAVGTHSEIQPETQPEAEGPVDTQTDLAAPAETRGGPRAPSSPAASSRSA